MEIQRIRLIRFTWTGENSFHKNNAQQRNDADGKLQKVSERCLMLCSEHYIFSVRIPFIIITMQTHYRTTQKVTKIDEHLYLDILDMKIKQSSVLTYHPYINIDISFFLLFHLILFPLYNAMLSYIIYTDNNGLIVIVNNYLRTMSMKFGVH